MGSLRRERVDGAVRRTSRTQRQAHTASRALGPIIHESASAAYLGTCITGSLSWDGHKPIDPAIL
eukprot:COSAG01_NODE_7840_length_3031_cov_744.246930_4_plen_65_part_00